MLCFVLCFFFFFNDTATTEIYTLSLHDALPILPKFMLKPLFERASGVSNDGFGFTASTDRPLRLDRKSTRLNSSHLVISYAVFCLKKKKKSKKSMRPSLTRRLAVSAAATHPMSA